MPILRTPRRKMDDATKIMLALIIAMILGGLIPPVQ